MRPSDAPFEPVLALIVLSHCAAGDVGDVIGPEDEPIEAGEREELGDGSTGYIRGACVGWLGGDPLPTVGRVCTPSSE